MNEIKEIVREGMLDKTLSVNDRRIYSLVFADILLIEIKKMTP